MDETTEDTGLEQAFKALDELQATQIEPSSLFRDGLWRRIEKEKTRRRFPWLRLSDFNLPQVSQPKLAFGVLALLFAWGAGLTWGNHVYNNKEQQEPLQNASELIISGFASSYPPHSIEGWTVQTIFQTTEE